MNLTIREREILTFEGHNNTPTRDQIDQLHRQAVLFGRQLGLDNPESDVLAQSGSSLKAKDIVGILAIRGLTLEILPKISVDGNDEKSRDTLIRMLSVARDLKITGGKLSSLSTQRHSLLEFLIDEFVKRLNDAIRRGLPRRYQIFEEDLSTLRGKLNVHRQATHLISHPGKLACRFDELSENTPLNRVLKATVRSLLKFSNSSENTRNLHVLSLLFDSVSNVSHPLKERVILNRTNTEFHDLYRWAQLFLKGIYQSTSSGEVQGITLLFPMYELFEIYIGKCLKREFVHQPSVVVSLQNSKRAIQNFDNPSQTLFNLRPDIWIKSNGVSHTILDTKWKKLKQNSRRWGVKREDLYQILTYSHRYAPNNLILLYPWHPDINEKSGVVGNWRSVKSERPLRIATVDITQTTKSIQEELRKILEFAA